MVNTTDSESIVDARAWWALLALISTAFVLWTFVALRQDASARWEDTQGYLAHALYVAEHGGLLGFMREAYTGVFPIVERHPLYFLMLAPFASRTAEFFWNAKVLDLITGLVVLLSLVWMVNRRYGRGPALVAALLYAVSNSLVMASSHVDNDTLFTLCTLWAWWLLTDVREQGKEPTEMPSSALRWALGGAVVGLSFLAKSPGILLCVAIVVAGLWYTRAKVVTSARLWVFLAAALLLASPLLVRNIVGFGTPLYESINSRIEWMDRWMDIGDERSIIYYDTYGVTTIERDGLPTAADYFRSHSIVDALERFGEGAYAEFTNVIPSALGSPLLRVGGRALGFAVFGLALVGWWLRRRSWDATLTFFWSAAFITFFSWDTLFPEVRYLAPLVPVWIAFAAFAAWRIGVTCLGSLTTWRLQIAASCALVFLALGWNIASGKLTQPRETLVASPSYFHFVDWLNRNAEPGDRIMVGETREFYGLLWMIVPHIYVVLNPSATTLDGFLAYLHERKVRYLLMHPEYLAGLNRGIAAALEPYFEVTPDGDFVEKQPLPGWRPVLQDQERPGHFLLYEALDAGTAP